MVKFVCFCGKTLTYEKHVNSVARLSQVPQIIFILKQ